MADEDVNINIGSDPSGVERGTRRAKVAIKGVAQSGKELDSAFRKLKSAIDPTFAAQEKLNQKLKMAKQLLDAGKISQTEYTQAKKLYRQELNKEMAAITRNSAAGKAAAAEAKRLEQQKVADARAAAAAKVAAAREERKVKEQLEAQEQRAIKLSASLARKAALEAQKAAKAPSRRAIGKVDPAVGEASRSIKQLENDIQRAMGKAEKLSARAVDQAAKAAQASSAKVAAVHEGAAQKATASAVETKERIIQLERQKASQVAQVRQQEIAAEKAATAAAREATAAAASAAAAKKKAAKDAARASQEAAIEIERQAKAERQAAQAAQELRASIDPAFAAQQRYNETMRRATQLMMQNKLATGEWTAIQRQAKAQMDLNSRSLGAQNARYVQLGYQAQDVTASLASGISPLVILAQQGGQTAAAMSTMGGTAGRVAAFFAGPWGAAIIGATLLLGFLWDSMSEGEDATKDLMNAEDRRKMTVKELTSAIRDYTRAQKEANDTTIQGLVTQVSETAQARAEIYEKLTEATERLTRAQKALDAAGPMTPASAIAGMGVELKLAEKEVKRLKKSYEDALEASGEAYASYAQSMVKTSELEKKEQAELTAALEAYRRENKAAGEDSIARAKVRAKYDSDLARIQDHYTKLKEKEAAARKDNARAADAEGKAIFKSREAAIGAAGRDLQKTGYNVAENNQFGGVRGNHPGMGNKAHGQYAIDINIPGAGVEANNAVARRRMTKMVEEYQAQGFRVLWNGKVYEPHGGGASYDIRPGANQHRDHAHMEAPQSIVGKPAGSSLASSLVQDAAALAEEERRIEEDRLRDKVATFEFEQELNRDNLDVVLAIQQEKISALAEFYGVESREVTNAHRERIRMERARDEDILDQQRRAIERRLDLMLEGLEAEAALRDLKAQDRNAVVDFAAQQGAISPEESMVMKAAILDQEYQAEVDHQGRLYQERVAALTKQLGLANLSADARRELHEQIEDEESSHLTKMGLMHQDYNNQVNQLNRDSAALNMEKWREFTSSFSSTLQQSFQGLWTHSLSLQQAFVNMADAQVYRLAEMGTRALEDWILKQVTMTGVQQAQTAARLATSQGAAAAEQGVIAGTTAAAVGAEAVKTGAAISGAATQTAVGAAAGTAEVGTRAATAAAGAYSSTVVIPFIGPVAAPVAAAAALAAVLGFGALISSRGGQGEVPMDGQLSMLHKKETVLPAYIAEPMRQMFVSPRSRSGMVSGAAAVAGGAVRDQFMEGRGGVTYGDTHLSIPLSSIDTQSGVDFLMKNRRVITEAVEDSIRKGMRRKK